MAKENNKIYVYNDVVINVSEIALMQLDGDKVMIVLKGNSQKVNMSFETLDLAEQFATEVYNLMLE